MRPLPVERVSGAPAYVAGLAVIRGVAVPVVEMSRWLGGAAIARDTTGATGGSSARFVTVRAGEHVVALAVDAVVGIRTLAATALHDLPSLLSEADSDAIASVGTLDAELLLCLRAARLVPREWARAFAAGAAE
jgi:purine-binding chemotaxis protein CheW